MSDVIGFVISRSHDPVLLQLSGKAEMKYYMGPLFLIPTILSIVRSVITTPNLNSWHYLIGTTAPAHSTVFSKQLRPINTDGSNRLD